MNSIDKNNQYGFIFIPLLILFAITIGGAITASIYLSNRKVAAVQPIATVETPTPLPLTPTPTTLPLSSPSTTPAPSPIKKIIYYKKPTQQPKVMAVATPGIAPVLTPAPTPWINPYEAAAKRKEACMMQYMSSSLSTPKPDPNAISSSDLIKYFSGPRDLNSPTDLKYQAAADLLNAQASTNAQYLPIQLDMAEKLCKYTE